MIGLDFPVKPEWIHGVLRLWQPDQPLSDLVQAALTQAMPELGGEKTRRNSLTIILRYFVPTVGGGQTRRTTEQNVWAAYAARYDPGVLAPAFLARIIAGNEVAREATLLVARRRTVDGSFSSAELRRLIIARFGERKVVTNSVSAFLKTLVAFGVLYGGERLGDYQFGPALPVDRAIFPLLVFAWWEPQGGPQISLEAFAADPAFSFLDTDRFPEYWRDFTGGLWSIEERLDNRRATLKYADPKTFKRAIAARLAG